MDIDLNTFYTFTEFKQFPPDKQVEYLNYICEEYRVSAYVIASRIFGMDGHKFVKYLKENGLLESVNPEHYKASRSSYAKIESAVRAARNPMPTTVAAYLHNQNVGIIRWNIGGRPDKAGEYWAVVLHNVAVEDGSGESTVQQVAEIGILYFGSRENAELFGGGACIIERNPKDKMVWQSAIFGGSDGVRVYAWAPLEETPFPQLYDHIVPFYRVYSEPADE